MGIAPLVAAGAISAGGSLMSDMANVGMQQETNRQNMMLQHMTWQREDNAVQRRVDDLKKAGLSPVLAAGQAAQAQSPIEIKSPRVEGNYGAQALNGMNAALEMMQQQENIGVTEAQRDYIKMQTEAKRQEISESIARENHYNWQTESGRQFQPLDVRSKELANEFAEKALPGRIQELKLAVDKAGLDVAGKRIDNEYNRERTDNYKLYDQTYQDMRNRLLSERVDDAHADVIAKAVTLEILKNQKYISDREVRQFKESGTLPKQGGIAGDVYRFVVEGALRAIFGENRSY